MRLLTVEGRIFSNIAFLMNSSVGKPLAICQMTCGRKMRKAMAAAIHGPRVFNTRRSGVSSRPTNKPNPSQSVLILFRSERPSARRKHRPQAIVAVLENPHQEPAGERPRENVQRVHRIVGVETQIERRQAGREHREHEPERPAAKAARHESHEQHGEGASSGWNQTNHFRRAAEERAHYGEQQDAERRMVDVTPRQVVGVRQVVELVAVVSDASADADVNKELDEGERHEREQVGEGARPFVQCRSHSRRTKSLVRKK